jgi:poly(A) polymerase Pap1
MLACCEHQHQIITQIITAAAPSMCFNNVWRIAIYNMAHVMVLETVWRSGGIASSIKHQHRAYQAMRQHPVWLSMA